MGGKEDEDEVKEEGEGEARVGTMSGNNGGGVSKGISDSEVNGDACEVVDESDGDGEVDRGDGDGEVAIGAPTVALGFR